MDFFEVGVYVMIIIIASLCVFGVIWLLMRSMRPKRARPVRRSIPAQVREGRTPKRTIREGSIKVVEKRSGKAKPDSLLKLKELPDNRLLPEARDEPQPGEARERSEKIAEPREVKDISSSKDNRADVPSGETNEAVLPELPSMETPEEAENESEAPPGDLDLMSVFDTEEIEDSGASDLAANLFDVDVQNIERLSNEVSEYLNGMRSK